MPPNVVAQMAAFSSFFLKDLETNIHGCQCDGKLKAK